VLVARWFSSGDWKLGWDRPHDETADIAVKVFELSQSLREKWLTADCFAKRRILEIVSLNCTLVERILLISMRKPFDVLAEGPSVSLSGGGFLDSQGCPHFELCESLANKRHTVTTRLLSDPE
jgi:hypothetical protein